MSRPKLQNDSAVRVDADLRSMQAMAGAQDVAALAAALGVEVGTFKTWRRRGEIPAKIRVAFAAIVQNKLGAQPSISIETAIENKRRNDSYKAGFVFVPRYDVRAAAGDGVIISDETVVDYLAFKRDWLVNRLGCEPMQVALFESSGDSMSPTINDRDLMLVDLKVEQRRLDDIYVVRLNEMLRVKRLAWRGANSVELISDNQAYGRQTLEGRRMKELTLIGRVRWCGREL
jgi:phage repressor protein C with HTH and peptisase S24 domain